MGFYFFFSFWTHDLNGFERTLVPAHGPVTRHITLFFENSSQKLVFSKSFFSQTHPIYKAGIGFGSIFVLTVLVGSAFGPDFIFSLTISVSGQAWTRTGTDLFTSIVKLMAA